MVINQKSKIKKNYTLWAVVIALLLLGSGVFYALASKNKLFSKSTPSNTGAMVESQAKENAANAEAKKKITTDSKTGPTTTDNAQAPMTSIELRAQQETNNTVTVFTKLYGYSDGSCELVVTNAGKITTQKAIVIYQPEASGCAGFSVPIGPLGIGQWALKLTVTANGTSENKSLVYEVK